MTEDTPTAVWERPTRRRETVLYGENLGVGAEVGGYVVEALRSRGGFATVYRARHQTLQRVVALKLLHSHLVSVSGIRRFEQEAQSVNLIRHPNVVDIYEIGQWRGRPYFVMEWLEGPDLEDELQRRGRFSSRETLTVLEDVCGALAAAHKERVIHRDLKASNVIAIPTGDWFTCKLIDFGVAKHLAPSSLGDGCVTTHGTRVGTPTNMAPEQILGGAVDERTDVYALGILAFHLLTGRLPFVGESPHQVEQMHLRSLPPNPSQLVDVPVAIDDVITRCLRKNPNHRFARVAEVLAQLRWALTPVTGAQRAPVMIGLHVESRRACGRAPLAVDAAQTVISLTSPDMSPATGIRARDDESACTCRRA
jgi:serine/threonine protein kinase